MSEFEKFLETISEGKRVAEENNVGKKFLSSLHERIKEDNPFAVSHTEPKRDFVVEAFPEPEQVKDTVSKYLKGKSFQQPNPDTVSPEMKDLQTKIKFLETWLGKIAAHGPGSGEVNFRWLDDVDRSSIDDTNKILRYDPETKKFFFGYLTGDQGKVKSISFDTAGTQITREVGTLSWNPINDCLDIVQTDGTILQSGLEQYIRIVNDNGSTLQNGEFVKYSGVMMVGEEPLITVERYVSDSNSIPLETIGVVTEDIEVGETGRCTRFGKVRHINTTGSLVSEIWQTGDTLWAHPSIPGALTKNQPTAPNVALAVAVVLRVHATEGIIFTNPIIFPRLYYGSFSDSTNQVAALINTPYPVTLNTTNFASGIRRDTVDTSKIIFENEGLYNFQFSLQVTSSSANQRNIWVWYRKNGVDVPRSAKKVTIQSNGGLEVPSWSYIVSAIPNDYVQIMWAVDSVNVSLTAPVQTSFCPSTPSALVNIFQVNL